MALSLTAPDANQELDKMIDALKTSILPVNPNATFNRGTMKKVAIPAKRKIVPMRELTTSSSMAPLTETVVPPTVEPQIQPVGKRPVSPLNIVTEAPPPEPATTEIVVSQPKRVISTTRVATRISSKPGIVVVPKAATSQAVSRPVVIAVSAPKTIAPEPQIPSQIPASEPPTKPAIKSDEQTPASPIKEIPPVTASPTTVQPLKAVRPSSTTASKRTANERPEKTLSIERNPGTVSYKSKTRTLTFNEDQPPIIGQEQRPKTVEVEVKKEDPPPLVMTSNGNSLPVLEPIVDARVAKTKVITIPTFTASAPVKPKAVRTKAPPKAAEASEMTPIDVPTLSAGKYTVGKLKELARERGIPKSSTMNKEGLKLVLEKWLNDDPTHF